MSDITTAELVNLLRVRAETQNKRGYSGEASEWLELADLIESLQAQLEQKTNEAEGMRSNWYKCIESLQESQRRADAAVEDLKLIVDAVRRKLLFYLQV